MPVTESIETKNNQLLAQCYEQLINNNINDALSNITNLIIQYTNAAMCCISVNRDKANKLYHCANNDQIIFSENKVQQFFKQFKEIQPTHSSFNLRSNSNENISLFANSPIKQILGYSFNHNNNELILLAFKEPVEENIYSSILQKLSTAISKVASTTTIQEELFFRNDVYESTLYTLNQIIWDHNLKTDTTHVMGFAHRIGNFIPQKTFQYNIKDWLLDKAHPDDMQRVMQNYEQFILQKNNTVNEIKFRMFSPTANEYFWVQTRQTLLYDETGEPALVVGTTIDIQDTYQIAADLEKHKIQNLLLVESLQESNEKLLTILNSSKEIIFTIDLQTSQFENVNKAISLLGYTPKEWIGQNYTQWSLDKRKKFHNLLKHASASNNSVKTQQISFTTKDEKTEIPFEFSTSVFTFKNKKYLLCILRDISERVAYENSIKQVTEQLAYLINNIDDVYAIYNLQQKKYEFVSNNIEYLYGCSKDTYLSNDLYWKEIIFKDDYASIESQMNDIISNKSKGEFFYRINTPVGETKMLLEKVTVTTDKDGNADKLFIVKSDYTNLENAEQNLIESERKFRFISENITDFISIIDIDGRFMYASPSSVKVIGYTTEELIGKNIIFFIHAEDVTNFLEEALEKIVFNKEEASLRYRLNKKDGSFNWVETYFKPIIDANNDTTSIICSTRDVTEREQLMKELQQSLNKERALNELRAQFVSMASHQFRTPLTVIQSGIELMQIYIEGISEQKQQPFKKQFLRIESEVSRLQDLMNDVLLLGRAEANRTPYNPTFGNIIQFCRDIIESRYNNQDYNNRKVILYIFGTAQEVMFDAKLLDHTLENILSNAFKYSNKGDIKFTITFSETTVNIAVKDQGIGIPANEIENLFQPFYRATNATEFEGTGLGLSIVNEFIETHGGKLFVESEIDKGTTVNIQLPLYQIKK